MGRGDVTGRMEPRELQSADAPPVLDDIDARPGSVASLLRTTVGLYLRRLGGWIATADLVALLGALDIPAPQARTGIARLRRKGLLVAERRGAAGYRVNPAATPMLERGDRRIFSRPSMAEHDPWCLISFSFPEDRREVRGRLRRRLQWIGAGSVAPGLWICPGYLLSEAEQILTDLEARNDATLFLTSAPLVSGTLAEAVARWWDLDELAQAHRAFLAYTGPGEAGADAGAAAGADAADPSPLAPAAPEAAAAFARYVHTVDRWRPIPYTDPGLPAALLPADWPGTESAATFERVERTLHQAAWAHVAAVTAPGDGH